MSFVIGYSNFFGFGFTALDWNLLLSASEPTQNVSTQGPSVQFSAEYNSSTDTMPKFWRGSHLRMLPGHRVRTASVNTALDAIFCIL